MRGIAVPLIFLAASLAFQEAPRAQTAKAVDLGAEEFKKLDGEWTVVEQEIDGIQTKKLFSFVRITLKQSRLVYKTGDFAQYAEISLNPAKQPKQMDVTFKDDTGKDTLSLAIYDLQGDKLKICLWFGGTRPAEFFAKKEGQCLWVCERAK
jgi:uncharacterized protein (TIGR03067 family)